MVARKAKEVVKFTTNSSTTTLDFQDLFSIAKELFMNEEVVKFTLATIAKVKSVEDLRTKRLEKIILNFVMVLPLFLCQVTSLKFQSSISDSGCNSVVNSTLAVQNFPLV